MPLLIPTPLNRMILFDKKEVSAAAVQTTYVYDTFTDTDATAIASHTPDIDLAGNGYTGTGTIQSNQYAGSGSGRIDTEVTPVEITATVVATGAGVFCGPIFRANVPDMRNYWQAYEQGTNVFVLRSRVNFTYTIEATVAWDTDVGDVIVLTDDGTTITATITGTDGEEVLQVTDSTLYGSTEQGVASNHASGLVNDLLIRSLP